MIGRTSVGVLAAAAAVATGALAGSGAAAPLQAAATGADCPIIGSAQVFSRFGDTMYYSAVTGGNMETPDGWVLLGAAGYVAGNEPFYLLSKKDRYSLKLSTGGLANGPWVCTGVAYPSARFMVRNVGVATGRLSVDVQYFDGATGVIGNVHVADVAATSAWAPSPIVKLPLPSGATTYRINFMPVGSGASFQLDDLVVDPPRLSFK